ncbi:hypothetical protein Rsub_09452 [Raphidocelis subcapitata]|uniref:KIF-binding protein n=1 Tax=Raphidocelis subcapitata TaxID=307507 RepID=A0A2V0PFM5_9CHLO|nr:hypothetical protein Rsub_09452 [Raphidocelis subcapitata]|eukprot:GBF96710.1 hypothetical protein Rsub_09452 [Raphidocelis subcapitata]
MADQPPPDQGAAEAPEATSWAAFEAGELRESLSRVRQLLDAEAHPSAPYAERYAAADALSALAATAASLAARAGPGSPDAEAAAACAERLRLERGLALLRTDLLGEGEPLVAAALARPAARWPLHVALRARNALGALWCDRDDAAAALRHLQAAEGAYAAARAAAAAAAVDAAAAAAGAAPAAPGGGEAGLAEGVAALRVGEGEEPPAGAGAGGVQTGGGGGGTEEPAWASALAPADAAAAEEEEFTQTLFFLAQVHALLGDRAASAAYSALDANEWVQNALQLSGFYVERSSFAMARYCLEAVRALLEARRAAGEGQGAAEGQRAGERERAHGAAEGQRQEEGDEQQQRQTAEAGAEAEAGGEGEAGGRPDAAADVAEAAEADSDARAARRRTDQRDAAAAAASPRAAAPPASAADAPASARAAAREGLLSGGGLDADVAANVALAWGKLFLYRLVASHGAALAGRAVEAGVASPGGVPDAARFDSLPGVPPLEALPEWGGGALVTEYEGARALANAALPLLSRALEHYQLDGWVSEHVETQLEISNVYRLLADFDGDPRRRAATQLSRTRVMGPLVGAFSAEHYPGLSKSVVLENANAWREVAAAREDSGAPAGQAAAAAREAAAHYQLFLASLRPHGPIPAGGDAKRAAAAAAARAAAAADCSPSPASEGAPLDRLDPGDEPHAVRAAFHAGCLLHTAARLDGGGRGGGGGGGAAARGGGATAQELLRWVGAYAKKWGLDEFEEEAALADELAGLLDQRDLLLEQARGQAGAGGGGAAAAAAARGR